MCDILFIVPTFNKHIDDESTGTLLLATILKQHKMNVDIYRFHEVSLEEGFLTFLQKSVHNILAKKPKVISFYCRCDCYLANIQMARLIKEEHPNIPIVFAGPQADASSYETLINVPWVDFCCSGEGETTVYPFFSALINNTDYTDIAGLSYRTDTNEIIENKRPALIEDLNTLPTLDYTLIPEEIMENSIHKLYFPIEVGRGCPFNCAFCSTSIFWERKFRLINNDIIINEIEFLNKKYGAKRFKFRHDLFTANKKRTIDFCHKLKEKKLDIEWKCSARIDTIDEECIATMSDVGLTALYIGIETGSERMQKITHKNLKISDILRVSEILTRYNISTTFSFIYGFPDENEDDIEATLQLVYKLLKMGHKKIQFHLYAMLPGTEYYEKYKNELVFSTKHSNIVGSLGTEEFEDYINQNKSVFPFYCEYITPLRKKYESLENCAILCIRFYEILCNLIPEIKNRIKITDIYIAIKDSNSVFFENNVSTQKFNQHKFTLYKNTLNHLFLGEELQKLESIFDFLEKQNSWINNKDSISEVYNFNTDIKAYLSGATLDKISNTETIVYLNRSADKMNIKTVNLPKIN